MNTPWGSIGDGWAGIVQPLIDRAQAEGVRIAQIKEKFGGLRFYTYGANEAFQDAIDAAETLSFMICEDCGAPGKPRGGSWTRTLCDAHHQERE